MSSCETLRMYYIMAVLQSLAMPQTPTYEDIRKITKDADILYKGCVELQQKKDQKVLQILKGMPSPD